MFAKTDCSLLFEAILLERTSGSPRFVSWFRLWKPTNRSSQTQPNNQTLSLKPRELIPVREYSRETKRRLALLGYYHSHLRWSVWEIDRLRFRARGNPAGLPEAIWPIISDWIAQLFAEKALLIAIPSKMWEKNVPKLGIKYPYYLERKPVTITSQHRWKIDSSVHLSLSREKNPW